MGLSAPPRETVKDRFNQFKATILEVKSTLPVNGQTEAFVASILDGVKALPDLDDAVKTHEVIFAADRSAATGKPVQLPLETIC
jgi:predicted dehydrogenase